MTAVAWVSMDQNGTPSTYKIVTDDQALTLSGVAGRLFHLWGRRNTEYSPETRGRTWSGLSAAIAIRLRSHPHESDDTALASAMVGYFDRQYRSYVDRPRLSFSIAYHETYH